MSTPIVIPAVLQTIAAQIATMPGAESLLVFGSGSTLSKQPADLDIVLWAETGLTTVQHQLVKQLLQLARKHYGWLDVFVWDGTTLHVRNDMATAYVNARNSRGLLKAMRTEGKPLAEVIQRWCQL